MPMLARDIGVSSLFRKWKENKMVTVRLVSKEAFNIIGIKTWIPGTDNEVFGEFWEKSYKHGEVERIMKFSKNKENSCTKSTILGLSCTEKDPNIRSFYFYIAVETDEVSNQGKYEVYKVKPYEWAIFSSDGTGVDSLLESEMYAWKEWLPNNNLYEHDNGPEMEVYFDNNKVEYWLPIRRKNN